MDAFKVGAVIPSLEHTFACQVRQVQLTFNAILVSHPYSVAISRLYRNGVNEYHLQLLLYRIIAINL